MRRIGCTVVVREVAGNARRRKSGVNIVFMAGGTLYARMRARQWERSCAVIERCSRPGCCIVTGRTLLRISGGLMRRIGCAVVVREMTGDARRRKAGIDIVYVAGGTLYARMRARQGKRSRPVIEGCSRPGRSAQVLLRSPG